MRRRRGLTLLELMMSMGLLISLFLLTGTALRIALRSSEVTAEQLAATHRVELLRTRLSRAARGAQPIPALSLLADAQIVEDAREDAVETWREGQALLLRDSAGYTVIACEQQFLVARRIDSRGHVTRNLVLRGVVDTEFELHRDARGRVRGISFRAEFKQGPGAAGFVALRTVPAERQLALPTLAPRYGAGGR